MTILQQSFMLRTPDGAVEKISIKDWTIDCANYVSRSGLTFNGCFRVKHGDLAETRGLYKLYRDSVFTFLYRGKITRDLDVMKDLVMRFMREFNITNGLVYYANDEIRVYDRYKKVVMLEDTPFFTQGHLFVYKLKLPFDFSAGEKVTEESLFNHKITFENPVNVYYQIHDDFHIRPGVGFVVQKADEGLVKISSPDHGEALAELSEGLWLFIHSPPTQKVD